jgi:NADPH:quinone reductase-like Zn-dependent oxidoreductase
MARRLKITGSLLRPRSSDEKSELIERAMKALKPYLDAKAIIRPVVQQIYEANDIVKSHKDLEDGLIMGKAVIKLAGAEKDW